MKMSNMLKNFVGSDLINVSGPEASALNDNTMGSSDVRQLIQRDEKADRNSGNSIGNGSTSNQLIHVNGLINNNNYVNFNQFVSQHNFQGLNTLRNGNRNIASYSIGETANNLNFYGSDGAYGGRNGTYLDNQNALSGNPITFYAQQPSGPNIYTNPFAYNNIIPSPSNTLCQPSISNSRSMFTQETSSIVPPGLSNNNSNTKFQNPFAHDIETIKASKLHASAQEFVPRFNNLSLNENTDIMPNSISTTSTNAEITPIETSTYESNRYAPDNVSHKNIFDRNIPPSNVNKQSQRLIDNREEADASPISYVYERNSQSPPSNNSTYCRRNQKRVISGNIQGQGNDHSSSNRKVQRNGRRSADIYEREDRFDNRNERFVSERYDRGDRNSRGGNRQRYDNHRSNKRRDDWNRNRDRANGFRVDEKYANDNGSSSPLTSPEKKSSGTNGTSPKKSPNTSQKENEKLSQREKLIKDIETRRLECLVCVEPIKSHQSVWSCRSCYHIFHLQCIFKWASSSISDDGWRCPACQNILKEVPRDYYCFCGKIKNPQFNRQDTAHSCGEVCGRIEGCTHACTLLCHPGPCPPCQASVKRECGCGKSAKLMQCCLKEDFMCDSICGKVLNCELHSCTAKCHHGKCEPCGEKVEQRCHCAKQERQVACTKDSNDKHFYSCGKPCGKELTCGNHKCKDCCHPGDCRVCKMSPEIVITCPCGKMPITQGQRKSCLDPIPTCEGVCGRVLRCGKPSNPHQCTAKCHLGNCPPCNKQTAIKCRCGLMDQMIKCRLLSTRADDARCKKRCTKKRSCGKHKCNQECCIDIDHICPLPCSYTLSCGKHKCDQPCHRGNCPPCYRSSFEELYCECGAEVIYPPVPCGTKRPVCKKPCSRSHPCDHPPQHNCHSGATCPPCMILTTKWCFGKHEQRKTIPCSQESFSCGLACNKPLPCGRHKCIKPCHEGPCQINGEICKQSCTKLRSNCGHKCMAPCHDVDCPDTPCKESVEVQCECGYRKQMRQCYDLVREYSRIATAQLASSMAEMQRGNYMELSEILAPVKVNKTNKTLDCNDECRTVERNRRLAIGLQTRNSDMQQKLLTKYSDFIKNFYKKDPVLVKSIHEALTNLVKLAKESKQKSRSHSFPTMNREKRQLVHEMCEMFGIESVAYDKEPNRNVVATAFKDRSWLPATSIMEVMARESGVRRVPVPSNNVWGTKR